MNVREALIKTLAENTGEYISGAALAEQLGVSRNAVWKAVKALEAEGYSIESVTSKGYRMSPDNNRISAGFISSGLRTESLGRMIFVSDETGSTNNDAKEKAAAGASHGTVVIADRQTSGKGRLGRSFISPAGTGIYMSVIIRPDLSVENAGMITAAAAVAAAEAVEKLCGADVRIKWVNDLYLNGKKICGILTEASMGLEMKSLEYAVIGIGINVRSMKAYLGDELRDIVTSVEDETGLRLDRNRLCAELLNRLEYRLGSVEERAFLPEYRKREYLTGNLITANIGGNSISGKAVGVDDNANLIVELDDGETIHLNSGEANLCRIKNKS